MNRWYRIKEKKTGKIFLARKGFGTDGSLVAVLNPLKKASWETGTRMTQKECREKFLILNPLSDEENKKREIDFNYAINS